MSKLTAEARQAVDRFVRQCPDKQCETAADYEAGLQMLEAIYKTTYNILHYKDPAPESTVGLVQLSIVRDASVQDLIVYRLRAAEDQLSMKVTFDLKDLEHSTATSSEPNFVPSNGVYRLLTFIPWMGPDLFDDLWGELTRCYNDN